jgi:acetate kinase
MRVLAVNCGSSSLKARLVDADGTSRRDLMRGEATGLGTERATLVVTTPDGDRNEERLKEANHGAAMSAMLGRIRARGERIDASGHRIVHGGDRFDRPVRIDATMLREIEAASRLAPLHNAPALAALRATLAELGQDVPAVATFDTTFHRTMPPEATLYPIPPELAERHGIRRYGFHGLAHRWMVERYAALAGVAVEQARLITLQLGSGCSACAVAGGRSVETTMGLTPLEGLMMATRSGSVDPALATLLAREEGISPDAVVDLLNHRSGLLGVSGRSGDTRDLIAACRQGDERARLALAMYIHRVRMAIGAYAAVLNGVDAVVFGGGVGEHSAVLRAEICAGMDWLGLTLDPARNAATVGRDGRISTDGAAVAAYVVVVDEEELIVRDTLAVLAS